MRLAWTIGCVLLVMMATAAGATASPSIRPADAWLASASAADSARSDTTRSRRKPSRWYFGGNLGISIDGSTTHISIQPLAGYKFTPKFSVGGTATYSYLSDRRSNIGLDSHNYGGGLFSRYRFWPEAFAQIEFEAVSYDLLDGRRTIPFLLVGGGYARPLGGGTFLVVEILMDLIQDKDSPYKDWEPRVNVGINAGF